MKNLTLSLLVLLVIGCTPRVKIADLVVTPNANGTVTLQTPQNDSVICYTSLEGCTTDGNVTEQRIPNGFAFSRHFTDSLGNGCTVTDRFTAQGDNIDWSVEIIGDGAPWSAPISSNLAYKPTAQTLFWTSWSAMEKSEGSWCDPLVLKPLEELTLQYGGGTILDPSSMVIPLFSLYESDKNAGLSLWQSPRDTIFDMCFTSNTNGQFSLSRTNHKISNANTIRFHMTLATHVADWRAGVEQYVAAYPEFFYPEAKNIEDVAGCGAYSSYEGPLDTAKLKQMNFAFNWKASFDFPYMGLFLPRIDNPDQSWKRFVQQGVVVGDGNATLNGMERYMRNLREQGFNTLCYFNVTEVGNHILYPAPPRKNASDNDLWRDANDFVYYGEAKNALLRVAEAENDSPYYSNWEGCVVVDPAEATYRAHLIDQLQRHIKHFPSSAGVCIDRLDWLRLYNVRGDDGISWKSGVPSQSMLLSWNSIMDTLAPMLHADNKVIFANVLTCRVDVLKHIDAIYDEYGQIPLSLNRSAFMTLCKPLTAWTSSKSDFTPDPDHYFQRHLYLGAYLTVPFPGNDHTITPDPEIEQYYLDYGEMLSKLKGKEWLLQPQVMRITAGDAKANIFKTQAGYAIPVVFGTDDQVQIELNDLPQAEAIKSVRAYYPASATQTLTPNFTKKGQGTTLTLTTPLVRGTAMIVVEL